MELNQNSSKLFSSPIFTSFSVDRFSAIKEERKVNQVMQIKRCSEGGVSVD